MKINQLSLFIAKVSEIGNLDEKSKKLFISKLNEGFIKRIIVARYQNVDKETLENLFKNPNDENITIFINESMKDDEGKRAVGEIIVDFVKTVLEPILPKLTKAQRREIFANFE